MEAELLITHLINTFGVVLLQNQQQSFTHITILFLK